MKVILPDSVYMNNWNKRKEEAVFVVQRKDGAVLMMRKDVYPSNAYRITSGDLERDETPEETAKRELFELAGIDATPDFLFSIEYHHAKVNDTLFTSHVFRVLSDQKPVSDDEDERIEEFMFVPLKKFPDIARRLRELSGTNEGGDEWRSFGYFRAVAVDKVAEYLKNHQ